MPRRRRTIDDARRRPKKATKGFEYDEIVAAVCMFLCRGHTPSEIPALVQRKLGVKLNREQPWQMISRAASKGWIRYAAPMEYELKERLQEEYRHLRNVVVAKTSVAEDVSYHTAKLLLEMLRQHHEDHPKKKEIHIGFAGGGTLRRSARLFAGMLREQQARDLPEKIVFHAMVAGFNVDDPTTDPNSFFIYLAGDTSFPVDISFVTLPIPAILDPEVMEALEKVGAVQEALKRADEIDIIVTSAGVHWRDGHSALHGLFAHESKESLRALEQAGCIGDLMWQPIGPRGPIQVETKARAATAMQLAQLPPFIAQGKRVLLVLGPCGGCGGPKNEVLEAILHCDDRLITDLVVDSRAVRALFAKSATL